MEDQSPQPRKIYLITGIILIFIASILMLVTSYLGLANIISWGLIALACIAAPIGFIVADKFVKASVALELEASGVA